MPKWLHSYPLGPDPIDAPREQQRKEAERSLRMALERGPEAQRVVAETRETLRKNHYIARIRASYGTDPGVQH